MGQALAHPGRIARVERHTPESGPHAGHRAVVKAARGVEALQPHPVRGGIAVAAGDHLPVGEGFHFGAEALDPAHPGEMPAGVRNAPPDPQLGKVARPVRTDAAHQTPRGGGHRDPGIGGHKVKEIKENVQLRREQRAAVAGFPPKPLHHIRPQDLVGIGYDDQIARQAVAERAGDGIPLVRFPPPCEAARIILHHDMDDLVGVGREPLPILVEMQRLGGTGMGEGRLRDDEALHHGIKFGEPDLQQVQFVVELETVEHPAPARRRCGEGQRFGQHRVVGEPGFIAAYRGPEFGARLLAGVTEGERAFHQVDQSARLCLPSRIGETAVVAAVQMNPQRIHQLPLGRSERHPGRIGLCGGRITAMCGRIVPALRAHERILEGHAYPALK